MKKYILILFTLLTFHSIQAQNTVAKLKFEDAEKAFNQKRFDDCIRLIDETEKILGTPAPNTTYLRIMAEGQLWEASPYSSYDQVVKLRNLCNQYLRQYDIPGLEEKYKDVYDLSSKLPKAGSQAQLIEMGKQYKKESLAQKTEKAVTDNNLVLVEGGTFKMGSGYDEHEVTVDDFYIGKYEVTNKEYSKFFEEEIKSEERFNERYYKWKEDTKTDDHPANYITWARAMQYCKWLEKQYGGIWRLPTEAEWEYAARGGVKSREHKYSGSDDLGTVGWYNNTLNIQVVGKKDANELGIYDMSGNVWEWCHDWYDKNYYKNSPAKNPMGPEKGNQRVLRGGSIQNFVNTCSVYNRDGRNPEGMSGLKPFGFRVVYIP